MIAVVSCGRTGTNLILEVLTGSKQLHPSAYPEDKLLFKRNAPVRDDYYLTKCDTVYCKGFSEFKKFMTLNPTAKIIWAIRDPRDIILSKLRRGLENGAYTYKSALEDMNYMFHLLLRSVKEKYFPERILIVKMEDVIKYVSLEAKRMCKFLGIKYERNMKYPHERMRHVGKKERYPTLDKSQIGLWKQGIDKVYDGFFVDKDIDIQSMFKIVKPMITFFGYELSDEEGI